MYEKQIQKQLDRANADLYRQAVKSELGLMTKSEAKRAADKLAKRYLAIHNLADLYDNAAAKSVIQGFCLDMVVQMKRIAVSRNPKRKSPKRYSPRKEFKILRKVIK